MKSIYLYVLTTVLLVSCAHKRDQSKVLSPEHDGLRFESLNRYNQERIEMSHFSSPVKLCYQGKSATAFGQLRRTLDQKNSDSFYWNQIASCHIINKDFTEAKNALHIGLSLTKTSFQKATILNNLGVVSLHYKQYKQALHFFKESLKFNSELKTPSYNLAQIHLKFSHFKKAKIIITKLLRVSPKDPDYLRSDCYIAIMENRLKDAEESFQRIAKTYHSKDDIAVLSAIISIKKGNIELAQKALNNSSRESAFYVTALNHINTYIEKNQKK